MHLGHRNCEYSYYINGITLEALESEKDLGITISKDLKVSQQCKQAYSKASRMLGVIYQVQGQIYLTQFVQVTG